MRGRENPADLVLLGDEIFYCPTGVMELQCVSRTVKGPRCKKYVEYGQITTWLTLRSAVGVIVAYNLSSLEHDHLSRWRDQHCETHDIPSAIDAESSEWEKFDPDGTHAHMITSLDELVEQATKRIRDGVTEDWKAWHDHRVW